MIHDLKIDMNIIFIFIYKMTCVWDVPFESIILTKTNGVQMQFKLGDFITFDKMNGHIRIDLFTGKDPNGPMGIEYSPWIDNKWGTFSFSMRGNPHIICRPVGDTHYGIHYDWDTVEFVI